ncbi:RNA repair domain-containing protein [Catenulispora subtropica]|uniref:Endonuclease/exonuclease/phosphatase n=1 Tax=Catenulispora subtropica TaxID=450798 RepID=A0ABN2R507_9ACTN
MRTSQEIYHRIRWDARFDASRFVLGVEQRGREPKRVPLPSFDPHGEIPWHRVVFFEADGELVWDRASGLDALDASGAGLAQRERLLAAPFFAARTPHVFAFAEGRWRPASPSASTAPATRVAASEIKVLTWNTLWDRYDSDLIHTGERRPMLLTALAEADVDVIALQEVEPALLKTLLAEPWIRESWTISSDPRSSDVPDSGLALLTRLPVVEAGWHVLGTFKAVTAVVVETATGPVVVAVTHLSSDHSTDGAGLRAEQLAQLAEGLTGVEVPVVLVGDFNDDTDAPSMRLGLTDAWTSVHGAGDRTPTFDPTANPLAAVSSLSGEAKRLDRVLVRGWQASDIRLVGDVPNAGGLFVSDHYGITATLVPEASLVSSAASTASLDARPTARTAVAWIPPEEVWDDIQEVRRRHDPQVLRWPPHVNILFGFVGEPEFDAAVPLISKVAATVPAFDVHLSEIRHFTHRDDSTLWLEPEGDGWRSLHAALLTRFPTCRSRDVFTPHLTLGKVADPARTPVKLAPIATTVDRLAVLSRRGDEPMRVRAVVMLGTGDVRWADEDAAAESALDGPCLDRQADALTERVSATLPEAAVHVVGSRRSGTHLPGADLDLVAALPGTPDVFTLERRVADALGEECRVRQMVGARVPGLRIATPRLSADLVLAPVADVPVTAAVERRAELGETIAASLSAVSDAEAILALRPGPHVRVVKAWARARGLDAAPLGGLPGLAWALMAARCRDLTDFFETWAAHDWHEPIPTPTAPIRDLTLHLTPATRDLITEELYNAWETVTATRDPLPTLLTPPPLHRRHRGWAVLTLTSPTPDHRAILEGRVRGRTRSLLTALDDAGIPDVHAWPRPFHSTATELRFAIGLGRTPPTRTELDVISRHWLKGLTGVTIDLAENGEVPSLR